MLIDILASLKNGQKNDIFFLWNEQKKNYAQKMGHLGEYCAEPEATIVGVGAALPRVRLIMILESAVL